MEANDRASQRGQTVAVERRELVVGAEASGQRLDAWLAGALPDLSRSRLQSLISACHVRVDGAACRPSQKVRPGQAITVELPAPVSATPQPEALPLVIVFQDTDVVVVDKPTGLVVHPGAGRTSGTLVNALLHHIPDLSGIGGVLRPGIVHRLDRGTSGLLIVAKNDQAHAHLARQFAGRTVTKEYLAVVLGVPRPSKGTIDAPIGRDPRHRQRMAARAPRGRTAHTAYEVVEVLHGSALLRVRIRTGRTHQIRVHLASMGHPVIGDVTYGGHRAARSGDSSVSALARTFVRPALHAAHLEFDHPRTTQRLAFDSPLPADMRSLIEALRIPARA